MLSKLILFAAALALAGSGATAQRRGGAEQDQAYQGRREGVLRPLRDIERDIVPQMQRRRADYIGAELEGRQARYRLKFMREGSVIWVDVDGRTGEVVGRAGE